MPPQLANLQRVLDLESGASQARLAAFQSNFSNIEEVQDIEAIESGLQEAVDEEIHALLYCHAVLQEHSQDIAKRIRDTDLDLSDESFIGRVKMLQELCNHWHECLGSLIAAFMRTDNAPLPAPLEPWSIDTSNMRDRQAVLERFMKLQEQLDREKYILIACILAFHARRRAIREDEPAVALAWANRRAAVAAERLSNAVTVLSPDIFKSENTECPICHEEIFNKDEETAPDTKPHDEEQSPSDTEGNLQDVVETKACKHKFHLQCLRAWVESSKRPTCPMCRANVFE